MPTTYHWRSWRSRPEWDPTVPPADRDRIVSFFARVLGVIARLEVILDGCTDGDLIAIVGTARVERASDACPADRVLVAALHDEWQDEACDARVQAWTAALDRALAEEPSAVQAVVLNTLLARAFRALLANAPPRGAIAALTGLALSLEVEVRHVVEDVLQGAISPAEYRLM